MKPNPYKGPSLKRADSLPARLPSHTAQAAEVKPVRNPITRPVADTMPPTDLRDHVQGGMREAADLKCRFVEAMDMRYMEEHLWEKIATNPEYKEILHSVHPNYNSYSVEQKVAACDNMAYSHPRLLAEMAAERNYLLFGNEMNTYVTNGKDVLHIHPASLHLVKLNPDPKMEETLGKFPEAFRVPDPQQPPRPFSNHESPATFKADWEPPAGWKPPERFWDPPKQFSEPS